MNLLPILIQWLVFFATVCLDIFTRGRIINGLRISKKSLVAFRKKANPTPKYCLVQNNNFFGLAPLLLTPFHLFG